MAQVGHGMEKLQEILHGAPARTFRGLTDIRRIEPFTVGKLNYPIIQFGHRTSPGNEEKPKVHVFLQPTVRPGAPHCLIRVDGCVDLVSIHVTLSGPILGAEANDTRPVLALMGLRKNDEWQMLWNNRLVTDQVQKLLRTHKFDGDPLHDNKSGRQISPRDLERFGAMVTSFMAE